MNDVYLRSTLMSAIYILCLMSIAMSVVIVLLIAVLIADPTHSLLETAVALTIIPVFGFLTSVNIYRHNY